MKNKKIKIKTLCDWLNSFDSRFFANYVNGTLLVEFKGEILLFSKFANSSVACFSLLEYFFNNIIIGEKKSVSIPTSQIGKYRCLFAILCMRAIGWEKEMFPFASEHLQKFKKEISRGIHKYFAESSKNEKTTIKRIKNKSLEFSCYLEKLVEEYEGELEIE
ncbi:hypothetical protein [[Mycoplasma] gypis]|uniref:hypothetical protein n=1 Tax=[Mycoplasma] gypis TaxID=92404 RepID=UPI0019676967|nr:hypothetical protein [[Mycoplasma] gypis]MBN0919677.1 hypothetical protein [[Mycoplasma] gypis]